MEAVTLTAVEQTLREAGIAGPLLDSIMASLRVGRSVAAPILPKTLPDVGSVARQFHRDSLLRSKIVGTPVEDAGWNILLALFADTLADRSVSCTSAVHASGVPPTTALRYIDRLERDGLLTRRPGRRDRRYSMLKPTAAAMDRMDEMVRRFCVSPPPESCG